jgi:UDP-glucose 4-epimerase
MRRDTPPHRAVSDAGDVGAAAIQTVDSGNPEQRPPGRVLVLGGTGFIGSEIARAFLGDGRSVIVLARSRPTAPLRGDLSGAEVVWGDAGNPELLAELLDRVDHVVYAVGSMLPRESNANPAEDVRATLPGLITLLEQLRSRPWVALTQLSSGGTVYGNPARLPVSEADSCDPITSYGIVKLAAEKYIGMYATLYGVPARILRIGNAYGTRQPSGRSQGIVASVLTAALDKSPIRVFGDGRMMRDYVHVGDVARAAVALAHRPDGARIVNLGSGVGHTILDVIDIVSQVTGARPMVEHVPDRGFDVRSIILDVDVLRGLVKWEPVTLVEGIERTWHDLQLRSAPMAEVG